MSSHTDLVERLIEVTACNAAEAEHLLAACANNVEAAVALYFEQGGGSGTSSDNGVPPIIPVEDDDSDGVRAPIAPIREQLIGPEDDNFFASAPPPAAGRMSRVTQRVKVCPLRDFAREGALMEEQLQASGLFTDAASSSVNSRPGRRARAANMVAAAHSAASEAAMRPGSSTSSRLGDLFRPPTELLFSGTFQAARTQATKRERWLLVNVQSDNFDSQLLNRDVWSDKTVKHLVRRQFTLWQVDCDSSEGRRFVAFYHCSKLPYLCVIDPRTGEEVWRSAAPKLGNVQPDLEQFLLEHKDFSCNDLNINDLKPSGSKRHAAAFMIDDDDDDDDDEDGSASSSTTSKKDKGFIPRKRAKVLELSEEEQMALAIKNSMVESSAKSSNGSAGGENGSTKPATTVKPNVHDDETSNGSVEEFGDEESNSAWKLTSYEQQLGIATHEMTALKLRLLNATGTEELVQLRWPSDTKLLAMRSYISQQYPHIPQVGYKLICAFPRQTLETESNGATLKELGLHPSANLHLTIDD